MEASGVATCCWSKGPGEKLDDCDCMKRRTTRSYCEAATLISLCLAASVTGRRSLHSSNLVATSLLQSLGFLARFPSFGLVAELLKTEQLKLVVFMKILACRATFTIVSSFRDAQLSNHLGTRNLRRLPILGEPHALRTKEVVPSRHEILIRDTHPTTI